MHYFDININIKINNNTSNTNNTSCCCSCNICSISWQLLPKIAYPNLFLPRDCASPSRTFKGVQPHAATSLASRRLDLDLWTLRRDVFLAPPPCTRRKLSPFRPPPRTCKCLGFCCWSCWYTRQATTNVPRRRSTERSATPEFTSWGWLFIPSFTRFPQHPTWLGMGFLNHQQYDIWYGLIWSLNTGRNVNTYYSLSRHMFMNFLVSI